MITLHRTLILAALAALPALPTAAIAQPATPPPASPPGSRAAATAEPPSDGLSAQDHNVLAAAQQLAGEASQALEQWTITQAVTEDRLFARLYYPIAKTDPQKYSTPYDTLADHDLVGPEDKALARATGLQYAIVTDINGYVPAHNTRFSQPLTGVAAQDYVNNRTKRIFGDLASIIAARSEAKYLIQRVKLETGDIIYDLSVPVIVKGKHWGCVRIGYRRVE
jgi:methyl-accepting chemotaxis protein